MQNVRYVRMWCTLSQCTELSKQSNQIRRTHKLLKFENLIQHGKVWIQGVVGVVSVNERQNSYYELAISEVNTHNKKDFARYLRSQQLFSRAEVITPNLELMPHLREKVLNSYWFTSSDIWNYLNAWNEHDDTNGRMGKQFRQPQSCNEPFYWLYINRLAYSS